MTETLQPPSDDIDETDFTGLFLATSLDTNWGDQETRTDSQIWSDHGLAYLLRLANQERAEHRQSKKSKSAQE